MIGDSLSALTQVLRRAARHGDQRSTDGELLRRFAEHRDEAAFEVLLRRHGPMVMGVCLRIVRNRPDAEDAFQATFLVLVRKAGSIASRDLLANWLYAVAYNIARKATTVAAQRRAREKQLLELPDQAVAQQDSRREDLQDLLDEQLSALPEKYRTVVVLCDLQGHTYKQAAQLLGCPVGSVSSRLSRARTMLAKRLARRGLFVSGAALAAALSLDTASSCPVSIVSATTQAASLLASEQAADAGHVSARALALVEAMLRTTPASKLKMAVAVLILAGMATALGGVALMHPLAVEQGQRDSSKAPAQHLRDTAASALTEARRQLEGTWRLASVEAGGRALSTGEIKDQIIYPIMKAAADNENSKLPKGLSWMLLDVKGLEMKFDREGHVVQRTGHGVVLREGTCELDPGKIPKAIDFALTTRSFARPTTHRGIYEFDKKGALRICFAGAERPKDFSTTPDNRHVLWIFERVKKGGPDKDRIEKRP